MPSPGQLPNRPTNHGPLNPRQQQASAVLAIQRMAQHIMLQISKVDEALKKPNLDASERNNLIGYKAKFEHDLQSLRNAATGNAMNVLQSNAQNGNATRAPAASVQPKVNLLQNANMNYARGMLFIV